MTTIFSIIATTIGLSSISNGYVLMKVGYIVGPIITILAASMNAYTTNILLKCAVNTGRYRYEDIVLGIFGPRYARIASFANLFYNILAISSFIIYLKHGIP